MSRTSANIQQLKEMHTKLQNLNTNISSALGNSREFHTTIENKLQDSIIKLQQNLDQSVNTERVLQNEKILLNIHSHFQQKCTQAEEQNHNLNVRLNQMERQEQKYKDQIGNLNQQLIEKGLLSSKGQILYNDQGYNFSFKPNQSEYAEEHDQNRIFTNQQLEESIVVKNEIEKLHQEIEVLLQEKKNIIAQQEQNQKYLQQQQSYYLEQLHQSDVLQSELSTGSNNPVKANQVIVATFQQNDLQTVTLNASPYRNRQINNQQSIFQESIKRNPRFQDHSKSPTAINNDSKQIQDQRNQIQNRQKQSIHSLSPTKVNFSKCLKNLQSSQKRNQENKIQINDFYNTVPIQQDQENQKKPNYQEMLSKANQELQIQRDLQFQQTQEFIKERSIRAQMQMKLEELEAEKRIENMQKSSETYDYKSRNYSNCSNKYDNIEVKSENIQQQYNETPKVKENNSFVKLNESQGQFYENQSKYTNNMATIDSFSTPNQGTLCNTPQRNKDENMNLSKQFSKENNSAFTPSDNQSPYKQQLSNIQTTDQSISKFKPIHTTLKLNKVNGKNNENKINHATNSSPNKITDNQNISSNSLQISNSSNQINQQQIQSQLVDLISKLQTSMNQKKRNSTPLKDAQRLIETAKKFDYAIDDKLTQLKQILTQDRINSSNQQIISSEGKNQPQQYLIESNQIYTSEFNTSQ